MEINIGYCALFYRFFSKAIIISYTGCFISDGVLDYAWELIYSDYVSMQDDWGPLGLEIYKVSQKSVGHQTCFFLWNTLYLTTDLEGSVKMRLSLFDVLFAWNLPFLRYLVNFSISQNTTQLGHEWIWSNKILAVDTRIKEVNIGIIIFI